MESEKDCVLVHLIEPTETTDDFPSRFGGKPTWLADPQLEHLNCEICKSQLVFLCQLYSPLPMEWAYHRVLYVFYCEKCSATKKGFTIIRMQLADVQIKSVTKTTECGRLEEEYGIETDVISAEELRKIIRKANHEVMEEGEPDIEDDDEDEEAEEFELSKIPKYDPDNQEDIGEVQKIKPVQPPADATFQIYKKVTRELDYPVLLYYNEPLYFKKGQLHIKQKRCKHCKSEMSLQLQINSTVLNKFKRLAMADIGALFVITCTKSCKAQDKPFVLEECELQTEQQNVDTVKLEKELEKLELEEKKKEKKREKRRLKRKLKHEEKLEEQLEEEDVKEDLKEEEGEGDWD